MKILLLGANGQVGFELQRSLAPLGDVVPATRSGTLPGALPCERADLHDADALRALCERVAPRLVVNAAAHTAVDRAEDEEALVQQANGAAPGVLGAWAAANGAAVVHYSTDYVFDGSGLRPYREDDATAPLGAYGRSKLAGEQALRDSGAEFLNFRTAWVYAARGANFLRTMLRLARERERLGVVADQRGAPTPARL
ncbi:SDR family oxidoreductase, partial [Tahibacter caeni]|uniref:SDR family oxidoreductase n=1 Tax=Tahibacter caeni TaxID=1453545 RepID=UPI0021496212